MHEMLTFFTVGRIKEGVEGVHSCIPMETGKIEYVWDFPGAVWTHHTLWICAWAGGGPNWQKLWHFCLLFYWGDTITSMNGVEEDPYQYSYGNLAYLWFSRCGLDSPYPLDLRMDRWGSELTKALTLLFIILLRGYNYFYEWGGGGSIPVFLWEPSILVIFQVGSANTIHSLDPRMGRWEVKLTKFMATFFYIFYLV